jgi:hypothetical protein
VETKVEIKLSGKLGYLRRLVLGQSAQLVDRILAQWSKIYAAFIRRRFVSASRGDGTWKALSESTLRGRKNKNKSRVAILRDSGLLFSQLHPTFQAVYSGSGYAPKFGALVSFGGNESYPDGLTVTDVMTFHQTGGPNLPQRKIIVQPDAATSARMAADAKRLVVDELKKYPQ